MRLLHALADNAKQTKLMLALHVECLTLNWPASCIEFAELADLSTNILSRCKPKCLPENFELANNEKPGVHGVEAGKTGKQPEQCLPTKHVERMHFQEKDVANSELSANSTKLLFLSFDYETTGKY